MNTASAHRLTDERASPSAGPFANAVPRQQVVLVTLDGSPAAATALGAARCLAQQLAMPLQLLHIAQQPIAVTDLVRALRVDTMAMTEEVVVRTGDPVSEILRAVDDPSTYMTMMTTHGRAIETGRHLGHVTEAVVAATMRPVLLIRPEAKEVALRSLCGGRFLLPLDGSPTTARALGAVADIVQRLGGSFDVLFIADPIRPPVAEEAEPGSLNIPYYIDQPQHEWPSWMQEVHDHLSASSSRHPLGITTHIHMGRGSSEAAVLHFVANHHNDAIVLVRRSHLEPGHGNVLRAILDQTPCPVFLTGAAGRRDTVTAESTAAQH
jgi:nucleotide-binding universal stress UspA family protein